MMSEIECDIIAVLESLTAKQPLTDRIAAAMQRLSDQLPKLASPAVDTMKAERERIERLKGPPNPVNSGLTAPLPPSPAPDGELRKDFLEAQKRPHYRPSPPTGV
jgi:hypothetical protein